MIGRLSLLVSTVMVLASKLPNEGLKGCTKLPHVLSLFGVLLINLSWHWITL